jgi:hypothetical protein
LITFGDGDRECCLNYLFHSAQHGVFEPNFGKVDVTPEEAKLHNAALDKALVDGLDNQCEVGQGGTFYLRDGQIKSWLGTTLAPALKRQGRHYTFVRGGRKFRATKRSRKDDTIWVQRISWEE